MLHKECIKAMLHKECKAMLHKECKAMLHKECKAMLHKEFYKSKVTNNFIKARLQRIL